MEEGKVNPQKKGKPIGTIGMAKHKNQAQVYECPIIIH